MLTPGKLTRISVHKGARFQTVESTVPVPYLQDMKVLEYFQGTTLERDTWLHPLVLEVTSIVVIRQVILE